MRSILLFPLALCVAATAAMSAAPNQRPGAAAGGAARVIVALEPGAALLREQPLRAVTPAALADVAQRRADGLAHRTGRALRAGRLIDERSQVVHAEGIDSEALAAALSAQPGVAYAVVDRRRRALRVPNDPLFAAQPRERGPDSGQWALRAPDAELRSATNVQAAWDLVGAQPSVVVAVLDTGVLADHADLAGRVLPGYDMISDAAIANDGDGRDADPGDPGDWISLAEDIRPGGPFFGCGVSDSSWHGTMMSTIIAARADDNIGMAGVAGIGDGVRILPVRVLGKCGGYDSDIVAGMRWAVGLAVPGVPANPFPARVLNLSLGGSGSCTAIYREAVAAANAVGAVVVAAAGNSVGQAVGTPANCAGAIGVAGLRHAGSKVGFSDLGPEIAISAPGGNCINIVEGEPCLYPIVAGRNSGTRGPVADGSVWSDSFEFSVGTSFATPIVAGTAALMLSARPELTAADVRSLLQATARPFPTEGADNGPDDPTPVLMCAPPSAAEQLQCYCSAGLCGAGMLDAAAAVAAAIAADLPPPQPPPSGGGGGGAFSPAWLALLALATLALRRRPGQGGA
jgi:serine protease